MADPVREPIDALTDTLKKSIIPSAMFMQSAGSGLARGYAEAAECSAAMMRETVDELGKCTKEMLAARDPFGVAACVGTFLVRFGHRNAERAAEIGRAMAHAGTSMMTAQPDGSRPPVADGGSDDPAARPYPASAVAD